MTQAEPPRRAGPSAAHAHPPVRILWWLYFAVIAVDSLVAVFLVRTLLDGLLLVFWALGLVGLWGYLQRVPILARRAWMAYLGLLPVWLAINIAEHVGRHPDAGLMPSLAASLGLVVMCGPLAWALWCYVFHCPNVWRRTARAEPGSQ